MTTQLYITQASTVNNDIETTVDNLLVLNINGTRNAACCAIKGDSNDDNVILQDAVVIQSSHSASELMLRKAIDEATPLRSGDVLFVDEQLVQLTILGDYSDCGRYTVLENAPSLNDVKKALLTMVQPEYNGTGNDTSFNTAGFNYIMARNNLSVEGVLAKLGYQLPAAHAA